MAGWSPQSPDERCATATTLALTLRHACTLARRSLSNRMLYSSRRATQATTHHAHTAPQPPPCLVRCARRPTTGLLVCFWATLQTAVALECDRGGTCGGVCVVCRATWEQQGQQPPSWCQLCRGEVRQFIAAEEAAGDGGLASVILFHRSSGHPTPPQHNTAAAPSLSLESFVDNSSAWC